MTKEELWQKLIQGRQHFRDDIYTIKPILSDLYHNGITLTGDPTSIVRQFLSLDWDVEPSKDYFRHRGIIKLAQWWQMQKVNKRHYIVIPYLNSFEPGTDFYVSVTRLYCNDPECLFNCVPEPLDTGQNGPPTYKIGEML